MVKGEETEGGKNGECVLRLATLDARRAEDFRRASPRRTTEVAGGET